MKKAIKAMRDAFSNAYDRAWIAGRTRGFKKYYETKADWVQNVRPVLTEDEKHQIDEFYIDNYGKKIDYCYHNAYKFYSGKFDVRCFADFLNSPRLQHFVNTDEFRKVMADKNFLPHIAKSAGVKIVPSVVYSSRGIIFDQDSNIISRDEAACIIKSQTAIFVKPTVDSHGGS